MGRHDTANRLHSVQKIAQHLGAKGLPSNKETSYCPEISLHLPTPLGFYHEDGTQNDSVTMSFHAQKNHDRICNIDSDGKDHVITTCHMRTGPNISETKTSRQVMNKIGKVHATVMNHAMLSNGFSHPFLKCWGCSKLNSSPRLHPKTENGKFEDCSKQRHIVVKYSNTVSEMTLHVSRSGWQSRDFCTRETWNSAYRGVTLQASASENV